MPLLPHASGHEVLVNIGFRKVLREAVLVIHARLPNCFQAAAVTRASRKTLHRSSAVKACHSSQTSTNFLFIRWAQPHGTYHKDKPKISRTIYQR